MILTIFRPGLEAVRRFWKPFLLIELCGLLAVAGYFKVDVVHHAFETLRAWKEAGGYLAAILASGVSGAIVPELAKTLVLGETRFDRARWNHLAFNFSVFALLGAYADPFYRLLGHLFPSYGFDRWAVLKMGIDQFIYSPFVTLPTVAFLFTLREGGWSLKRTFQQLGWGWYLRRVVSLMVLCWCYWVPMALLMYSLPKGLTFVFAMFAQAAWGLLLIFAAAKPEPEPDPIKQADLPAVPVTQG